MNKLFFPQAERIIYFPLFAEQSFFHKAKHKNKNTSLYSAVTQSHPLSKIIFLPTDKAQLDIYNIYCMFTIVNSLFKNGYKKLKILITNNYTYIKLEKGF